MNGYEKSRNCGGGPHDWRTWTNLFVLAFAICLAAWAIAG
ncbi:hypothetical protein M2281_005430 [Mesorhizobium soli]|nr:hypothetical protein [Mesorhizobium soli]